MKFRRPLTVLAAVTLANCGSSSGGVSPSTPEGGSVDAPSSSVDSPGSIVPDASADSSGGGGTDAPSNDSMPSSDGSVFVNADVCGSPSGTVAWMTSIPAASSTLTLEGIVVGPTNDAIVTDQSGANYEQHRWDETGTMVSVHQDAIGSYAGPLWASSLFVDAHNNLFYGMLLTGLIQGQNSGAELTFTTLAPNGSVVAADPHMGTMPTSDGPPQVLVFDTGGDSGGGLHGAVTLANPQYFSAGVYCYGSNGSFSGISAASVTATMAARDFEWPNPDEGLYVTKRVTSNINLGCGGLTVPAAGGMVLTQLDSGGNCIWNKLLALPTQAIKANDFRLGADGSLALAVVYTGTIDFGGGPLTSGGTTSLGVARYSSSGALLWSKSFGGSGSTFALGSLGVNADGVLTLSAGYTGTVNLGSGALPAGADVFVAAFDATGSLKWDKTVSVGAQGKLVTAVGKCGLVVATNSPSVDLGAGPLSKANPSAPPTIGVAALGL